MRRLFTTTAILLTVGTVVPASAQSREQRQMMADVRMLQEQTRRLRSANRWSR